MRANDRRGPAAECRGRPPMRLAITATTHPILLIFPGMADVERERELHRITERLAELRGYL